MRTRLRQMKRGDWHRNRNASRSSCTCFWRDRVAPSGAMSCLPCSGPSSMRHTHATRFPRTCTKCDAPSGRTRLLARVRSRSKRDAIACSVTRSTWKMRTRRAAGQTRSPRTVAPFSPVFILVAPRSSRTGWTRRAIACATSPGARLGISLGRVRRLVTKTVRPQPDGGRPSSCRMTNGRCDDSCTCSRRQMIAAARFARSRPSPSDCAPISRSSRPRRRSSLRRRFAGVDRFQARGPRRRPVSRGSNRIRHQLWRRRAPQACIRFLRGWRNRGRVTGDAGSAVCAGRCCRSRSLLQAPRPCRSGALAARPFSEIGRQRRSSPDLS